VGFGNILAIVLAVAAVLVIGVVLYFVFTNKSQPAPQSSVRVVDTRATRRPTS
jgi:flagellar basal body-associated protein FliL